MLGMTLASLWSRRRRLVGTAVAVVLGVAFLSGTLVLGDTLNAGYDRLIADSLDGTDVVVRNGTAIDPGSSDQRRGLIDESLLEQVATVDGVADAEAQLVANGEIVGADGEPVSTMGPPQLAGSWITNPRLNPYRLVEGRAPDAPDEVVVNRAAAEDGDLEVGDVTTVQTPEDTEVTVVGVATFGDQDSLYDSTWVAWTLPAAQEQLTGRAGEVTSILVEGEPGTDPGDLQERVQDALPAGVAVTTGDDLAGERFDQLSETVLTMLRTFLVVFAGIAVVVATLSINNSFSVTVAQRTRELALLRAVGASRRQLRRMVTLEALLLGVGAAVVAVPLGLVVAGALRGLIDAVGFGSPSGGLEIRPVSMATAAGVGVLSTLLAAQAAARRAGRLAPLAAVRATGTGSAGSGVRRLAAGATGAVAGVGLTVAGAVSGTTAVAGVGAVAVVVGFLLLAPTVFQPVAGVVGAGLRRWRGLSGDLAEENTRRNPRRSAATATALVVGVAVVTLVSVLVTSIQTTLEDDAASDFAADLAVASPGVGGRAGAIDPLLVTGLDDLPEVEAVTGLGSTQARVDGDQTTVTAADGPELVDVVGLEARHGSLPSLAAGDLAVSETRADREGWEPGTTVDMTFKDGVTEELTVAAVFEDHSIVGDLVVPTGVWTAHEAQPMAATVLLTTTEGVGPEQAAAAVEPLVDRYGGEVRDRDDFATGTAEGLDMLLGVVYVLLALAIIIALLGIANILSLAVHERRHEIGLLRAVGQTRRQVRSVLRLESFIISIFGTLAGLAMGSFLGWALFTAVTADDGGSFALPGVRLVAIAVVGGLAGVLAAGRPARRAARLPVLEAIAAR